MFDIFSNGVIFRDTVFIKDIMNPVFVIAGEILLLVLLVCASAFFSSAEMSLFSLSRAKISAMKDDSSVSARRIYFLMDNYNRTLVSIILSNMFVNSFISMLNDTILKEIGLSGVSATVVSAITGILVLLLFGEITPMTLAYVHCERWSAIVAGPIVVLRTVLSPVVLVAEAFCNRVLDLLGRAASSPLTAEEYSSYIDNGSRQGAFTAEEKRLLNDTLELCTLEVSEIMIPRTKIGFIRDDASPETIEETIRSSGRMVLCVGRENVDTADRILYAYDYFSIPADLRTDWRHSSCVRPALFIPEQTSVILALRALRKDGVHAAIVSDEYGGVAGLVSLPNIYFALTGAYVDELPGSLRESSRKNDRVWEFDGLTPLDAVVEETRWPIDPDRFESATLNGLFCELTGSLPKKNAETEIDGARIRVLEVGGNVALRIEFQFLEPERKERSSSC